eukprot:3242273-Alexandrium_andersonii.AAC.1
MLGFAVWANAPTWLAVGGRAAHGFDGIGRLDLRAPKHPGSRILFWERGDIQCLSLSGSLLPELRQEERRPHGPYVLERAGASPARSPRAGRWGIRLAPWRLNHCFHLIW